MKLARLRRGYSMELVASRAGMSRGTLSSVESGKSTVTLGAVANVLHALGLEGDLAALAKDDELGRKLQDLGLPTRKRARKQRGPTAEEEQT